MNPLKQLQVEGLSIWLDFIRRNLITSGDLNRLIDEDGLRGMTSNPTIFEKAIAGSVDYDDSLQKALEKNPHLGNKELYETLAIADIQMAADVLKPVYETTHGVDGYVSLEVSPNLANDTEATINEARRLWKAVDRPNIMIKVPATAAGVPAFEELIAEGINVNVTLMFSLKHYEDIAQAYIRGLTRCKNPEQIASVASFFVSRVDAVVDKALEAKGTPEALALRGKIAVANAKLAYKRFQELFYGSAFEALKQKGARVQRPLWASTSTKNPEYNDVLYVEELIGADTVNTLPPATMDAFRDHGRVVNTLTVGVEEAEAQIAKLGDLGIDLAALTEKLQTDGVAAFAKSFEELLEALKKKRSSILSVRSERQYLSAGENDARVHNRVREWQSSDYLSRLWKKDPTLWFDTPQPELENRLGWLDLPKEMHSQLEAINGFAKEIHKSGYQHVVLLGMGGSSLAPEVFQRTFGSRKGFPQLVVLDSTHPAAIRNVASSIDLPQTLFLVSSKSGSTTETMSLFYYFWEKVSAEAAPAGEHFVAITDPGSSLEALATERQFRRIFLAPSDVGGRYSALSVFGLVPAALIGIDIHEIIDGAWAMAEGGGSEDEKHPALVLGAALGELALAGKDKLTITTSPSLAGLPAWIEQLVAESTGKDGKGILPVVDEPLSPPESYSSDRFFVHIAVEGETAKDDDALSALEFAGHPVCRIQIKNRSLIGQEFFRWEMAVAAAGSVLGIHPFNQPDVQLAKELAREAMSNTAAGSGNGVQIETLDAESPETMQRLTESGSLHAGDYVAIQAYLPPSDDTRAALEVFRLGLRDKLRVATTLGFGPRFLHSTGQLHKGGAKNGVFIQIVDEINDAVAVPETDYTFGSLIAAQAAGDLTALKQRGQRVLRIKLGQNHVRGLTERLEIT